MELSADKGDSPLKLVDTTVYHSPAKGKLDEISESLVENAADVVPTSSVKDKLKMFEKPPASGASLAQWATTA